MSHLAVFDPIGGFSYLSLPLISRLTLEVWQRHLSERDATSSIVSYASDFSPLNLWHPLWFEMEDTIPFE